MPAPIPLDKIRDVGIDNDQLQDIILTHFHSDHVAGVPNMLMHMWQMGRKSPDFAFTAFRTALTA